MTTNKLPNGWQATTLGNFSHAVSERNGGRDSFPVLSVTKYDGFVPSGEYFSKTVHSKDINNYKVVRSGQFAYATIHLDEGSVGYLSDYEAGIISPMYTVFEVDKTRVDCRFLLSFLKLSARRGKFDALGNGGVNRRKSISFKALASFPIDLPPLPEQRRIAEILSSVDDAIAATQAVLDQTRTVKQAVLKRLLTKGIGHTRFKQTEIGEIPEAWEIVSLESLLASTPTPMRSGPFGSALKKDELVEEGIPFLGIDNVQVEYFSNTFKRFVTPEKFDELRRFAVRPHDVMITIMGTVGRCCVVPEGIGSALSSKHVWTMTFDQTQYFPELICWQLNFAPWVLHKFDQAAQGGVMGAINSQVLKGLELPKPPIEEQKVILTVWRSFNDALYTEETKLKALMQTKSALMSDLLTGRKRVPATLLSAVE